MNLSRESIKGFKEWYQSKGGEFNSEQEAQEAFANLVGFFDLLLEWDIEDRKSSTRISSENEVITPKQ